MLDFVGRLQDANNAYRTRDYIITQEITFVKHDYHGSYLDSRDVYYKRTPERDAVYENVFRNRCHLNGERIPTKKHTNEYL